MTFQSAEVEYFIHQVFENSKNHIRAFPGCQQMELLRSKDQPDVLFLRTRKRLDHVGHLAYGDVHNAHKVGEEGRRAAAATGGDIHMAQGSDVMAPETVSQ